MSNVDPFLHLSYPLFTGNQQPLPSNFSHLAPHIHGPELFQLFLESWRHGPQLFAVLLSRLLAGYKNGVLKQNCAVWQKFETRKVPPNPQANCKNTQQVSNKNNKFTAIKMWSGNKMVNWLSCALRELLLLFGLSEGHLLKREDFLAKNRADVAVPNKLTRPPGRNNKSQQQQQQQQQQWTTSTPRTTKKRTTKKKKKNNDNNKS